MKVLITGAAGFLGSHLVSKYLDEGNEVIALDNLSTGYMHNLQKHISNPSFQFLQHDVTEAIDLNVDKILNFACPASPIQYQKNPVQTIRTSVLGAINMLDLALRCDATILQASTSEVYGDPEVELQSEQYWGNVNPIGIRSCYDEGKRAAESLFFDYHRQYGVDIKVIRIFNTYGPSMDINDGRVVSNFIVQALKNDPITIYGDGQQTRSFCYVEDLVRGIYGVLNTEKKVTGPINLGNPTPFTMIELAKLVIAMTGSKSSIKFFDLPGDDPKQRKPDISKARKVIGWEPQIDLEEGLNRSIAYFAERLNNPLINNRSLLTLSSNPTTMELNP